MRVNVPRQRPGDFDVSNDLVPPTTPPCAGTSTPPAEPGGLPCAPTGFGPAGAPGAGPVPLPCAWHEETGGHGRQ
ncbi:MAG TPA: hypothetical protein VGS19_05925, partial [Streptosporangiaceae bacterium]|nr:hypothetical protein [Streptosporangiaceae bacterium]